MKSSALSKILILLICCSCSSIRPAGTVKADRASLPCLKEDTAVASPLMKHTSRAIFRGSLDVRGHHFTGQVYVKRMPDSTLRIAFINEFGMTWFDFILNRDRITVAYCFEPMNKKALISIFRTNFELLFSAVTDLSGAKFHTAGKTGKIAVSGRFGKYRVWYTLGSPSCAVEQIGGKSGLLDKTLISLSGYQEGVPDSVTVSTPMIHMMMKLARQR
jgi:hypothetical protein